MSSRTAKPPSRLTEEGECAMNGQQFTDDVRAARERVDRLHERVATIPPPRHGELFSETYEELRTALEELRTVEEELRLQNEALAAAKHEADAERRRYQDLFEFAPDGYIVTDALGNIRAANRAAGRLLNAAPKNLVGKPLVVFIAPEERQFFHAELTRLSGDRHAQAWNLCLHPRDNEPTYV